MSSRQNRLFIHCLAMVCGAGCIATAATEYFVSLEGCDDTHDGRSRETAFATVQRGVDALDPGDTLTILPGEYLGSVQRDGLGSAEAVTTIRADISGSAVLRGDVPVDGFQPLDGHRFVHVAAFDGAHEVQAVIELDTLRVLDAQPNVALVAFTPGTFHHDPEAGKLYLSTPDLAPPITRRYGVSVNTSHGLFLFGAQRVAIEGLAVTGFHTNRQRAGRDGAHGGVYGIFLHESADCVVRDCRAWLNAQGIGISSGQQATSERRRGNNVIERCKAWANASPHGWGDMGGLTIFHGRSDTIRDSVSFRNAGCGVNIYNQARGLEETDENRSRLIGNVAWDNGRPDLKIKAGTWFVTERCAGGFGSNALNPIHSLFHRPYPAAGPDSIQLETETDLDPNAEFADPDHHDYRLQATSRFRGTGPDGSDRGPHPYEPNVFYLAPDGDDAADGLSLGQAWQSLSRAFGALRPGDTLYLAPGTYANAGPVRLRGAPEQPIRVRGRGRGRIRIEGTFVLESAAEASFERIDFVDGVQVSDSQTIAFTQCRLFGAETMLTARETDGLRIEHCLVRGGDVSGLALMNTTGVILQGNLFDTPSGIAITTDRSEGIVYSDYNAYRYPESAWNLDGKSMALTALSPALERYAQTLAPHADAAGETPMPMSRDGRLVLGPFGWPAGPHRTDASDDTLLRMHGPFVYTTTDTTANLEWWLSDLARFEISWATDPDAFGRPVRRDSNRFGSFSLTGLEPDTDYHLRLTPDRPFEQVDGERAVAGDADGIMLTFRTASAPEPPRTLHVAPDGDDHHNGLSRPRAWRTVQHAAGEARPGDTVRIHGGTYHESVRLRNTGEAGRPITFRAAPGEKVVFDGMSRGLDFVFLAEDKSHLRFDGLYFVGYGHGSDRMPWRINARGNRQNGHIVLSEGRDVQITRCFADGRGPGYAPGLLFANNCPDLVVENNAMLRCMGRLTIRHLSPRARVRHNVFLVNLIQHFAYHPRGARHIMELPDRPLIEQNIFTDNLLSKRNVSIALSDIYTTHRDNAFYLRVPPSQRVWLNDASFADMLAARDADDHTQVVDPGFQGTLDWERTDADGNPRFLGDRLLNQPDLDFPDLFATTPAVLDHGMGLQPEAFADFHFNDAQREH